MSRPNPNSFQYGKVLYVGAKSSREKSHVKTLPAESIHINYTGVQGDYHSGFLETNPARLPEFKNKENLIDEKHAAGYRLFRMAQVHLMDTNTAKVLKSNLNINLLPGTAGEQILIDGVDLNALHEESYIKIGPNVILETVCCRSYCSRFTLDIENTASDLDSNFNNKIMKSLFETRNELGSAHVGIYARVIKTGIVSMGDSVEIDPSWSQHYNKSDTPMLGEKMKEIKEARFKWFTVEQLLENDKIHSPEQIESFFQVPLNL